MNTEKIVNDNSKLIYKIASKFYGTDKEDLYQAGVVGLLKALKNYQGGDAKFSTYAYEYIYGEMYNLVNNKSLKINKDILKLYRSIEKARSFLSQQLGKIPSNKEVAHFLNMNEQDINDAQMAGYNIMSLDNDEQMPFYETIKVDEDLSVDDQILLSESLEMLTPNEKKIIKSRYYEDLTQMQTAKKLSMTQVMVSRYEKKGLNKMQAFLQK